MNEKWNNGLNWYGWCTPFSGYGGVTLSYSTAINKIIGDKLSIGWDRPPRTDSLEYQCLTEDERYLVHQKEFKRERIGIIKTTPVYFEKNISDIRIGYTMVENTKMGKKWVELCNGMDALLVPSSYLVNVFKESGVTKPIFQVRQGIDPLRFPYFRRKKNKEKFVFGLNGWLDDRKNWKEICRAFASEFNNNEPVELWVKNSNNKFGYEVPNDDRIIFLDSLMTYKELANFYNSLDCFVFTTRAEGAGMPPREAMATGLPVIMTNWSGMADVCDEKYNYFLNPVAIDLPDPRNDPSQPGFQARIDIAELMWLMRYIYEHQDEAKAKGKAASEWMHKDWTWEKCALDLLEVLRLNFNYE